MSKKVKHIQALPESDGRGHQITYEKGESRRVHHIRPRQNQAEPPPHGAGSFHDPEHHRELMDRVDAMLR